MKSKYENSQLEQLLKSYPRDQQLSNTDREWLDEQPIGREFPFEEKEDASLNEDRLASYF